MVSLCNPFMFPPSSLTVSGGNPACFVNNRSRYLEKKIYRGGALRHIISSFRYSISPMNYIPANIIVNTKALLPLRIPVR